MIVKVADLRPIRYKHQDEIIVFACGTFDLIHPGHVDFLDWCREQGDILVVAVNPDHLVRLKKGPHRPILPEQDRVRMVAALKAVGYAAIKNDAPNSRIASMMTAWQVQPDIIVLGHDWADDEIDLWREWFPDRQIIVGPEREAGRSTSAVINTIRMRHAEAAA